MVLHLNKLESPSPKDSLRQIWLKLAQVFWRRLSNFFNVILVFRNYPPLQKGRALHLNKLESPSSKDALCLVWLKLARWFWRKRFLNFVNVFSLFGYYLPLEKVGALHLNKLESPLPKLCAKLGWNRPSSSGEEDEDVKSLRQQRQRRRQQQRQWTTDKFWSEKLTWAFGSGELKIHWLVRNFALISLFEFLKLNKHNSTLKLWPLTLCNRPFSLFMSNLCLFI